MNRIDITARKKKKSILKANLIPRYNQLFVDRLESNFRKTHKDLTTTNDLGNVIRRRLLSHDKKININEGAINTYT